MDTDYQEMCSGMHNRTPSTLLITLKNVVQYEQMGELEHMGEAGAHGRDWRTPGEHQQP